MKKYVIGLDVGGTKIAAAIADLKGKILSNNVTPTEAKKGGEVVADQLVSSIKHLMQDVGCTESDLKNITLGIPGQIDASKGIVKNAPNINGWQMFDIRTYLNKTFPKTDVILENDAHCAAMGEFFFGSGKEFNDMIFITVSTGVGGGIIINRKLVSGSNNIAGEVGHMALNLSNANDYPCGCGRFGCLEAYASGTSLAKRARKKLKELPVLKDDYGKKLLELAESDVTKVTALSISQAAQAGDRFAIEMLEENGYFIGVACYNLINMLDPEAIIIGGGVSKSGDVLFNAIRKTVKENIKMTKNLKTSILPATTGTDAGILGTIAVGLSQ